jgi:hypothetical protein
MAWCKLQHRHRRGTRFARYVFKQCSRVEFVTDKIGSPKGAAFVYFLMQYKAQLGYKTITKITIIQPET